MIRLRQLLCALALILAVPQILQAQHHHPIPCPPPMWVPECEELYYTPPCEDYYTPPSEDYYTEPCMPYYTPPCEEYYPEPCEPYYIPWCF